MDTGRVVNPVTSVLTKETEVPGRRPHADGGRGWCDTTSWGPPRAVSHQQQLDTGLGQSLPQKPQEDTTLLTPGF